MTSQKTQDQLPAAIHILIVDDCDINQFVARQYLERSGYKVDIAENGQQALDACNQHRYDLILMDLVMPVMDGYEATRRIRNAECGMRNEKNKQRIIKPEIAGSAHKCACSGNNDQPQKHACSEKYCKCRRAGADQDVNSEFRIPHSTFEAVPIIGISGHDPESVMDLCCQAGMNGCISKPFQQASLVSIVQQFTADDCDSGSDKNNNGDMDALQPEAIKSQPPLDIEGTISEFMGKTDLLQEVLETFKARVRIQIIQIKQHLSVNNYHPILSEAHSIKGGAGNLGAFNLSKAAADLEQAAEKGSAAQATAAIDDLQNEFYLLYQYIEQSKIGTPS
jgi:CheY-like chemotaxis protein/HPt (histidine-containing phosphotransfer) domain-containing protein